MQSSPTRAVKDPILSRINYFYVSLALLWVPLQRAFLNIDGKGRTLFTLTIAIFLFNLFYDRRFLKFTISKPFAFWGFWVIYSILNLIIQGYNGELSFTFYCVLNLFLPFVVMVIVAKETIRKPKTIFQLLCFVFLVYGLLSITMLRGSFAQADDRILGELGNMGPLNVIFVIFFVSLLYINQWTVLKKAIPLILFAFTVLVLGATLKAFGAAIIMTLFLIISQIYLSPKKVLMVILLTIGLILGVNYTLENTFVGDRFEQVKEVGTHRNTTNIQALNLLGDRATFYINAWDVFLENPLAGVGLVNYRYKTKSYLKIHSEYMVQLAESGLIGTLFFILFNFWIGKKLFVSWQNFPKKRPIICILAGAFAAILFINVTAWTYDFPQYFAVFGVIIGQLRMVKYENSYTSYQKKRV